MYVPVHVSPVQGYLGLSAAHQKNQTTRPCQKRELSSVGGGGGHSTQKYMSRALSVRWDQGSTLEYVHQKKCEVEFCFSEEEEDQVSWETTCSDTQFRYSSQERLGASRSGLSTFHPFPINCLSNMLATCSQQFQTHEKHTQPHSSVTSLLRTIRLRDNSIYSIHNTRITYIHIEVPLSWCSRLETRINPMPWDDTYEISRSNPSRCLQIH